MQLIVSDSKTGQSFKVEVPKDKESEVAGKKVGEVLELGFLGAGGYKVQLTGGSDTSGFPMRRDIMGPKKTKALITKGIGFRATEKGQRMRKTIRGNTYSSEIMQINSKVTEYGPTPLDQIFKKAEKKEEKK